MWSWIHSVGQSMPIAERIIDLSEHGAHVSLRNGLLHVRGETAEAAVPLDELVAVLASHPRVSFTHAALAALATAGVMVVCSDEKRMPAAMLLPVNGNYIQTERFRRQAQISEPTRKRLWQQLVQAKIKAQAMNLAELGRPDEGMLLMVGRVRSGDPENLEAQAARRYWSRLFPGGFRRDRDDDDQNRLLNYGYAVLRAVVARCIVGSGLHPSFGLNHHNRYNAFCLADDLIEPFRPRVDRVTAELVAAHGPMVPLDRSTREALIAAVLGRVRIAGEDRKLLDGAFRLTSSLQAVLEGKARKLVIPEVWT